MKEALTEVSCRRCGHTYFISKKTARTVSYFCISCGHPYRSEKFCDFFQQLGLILAFVALICAPPATTLPSLTAKIGNERTDTSIWKIVDELRFNGSNSMANFLLISCVLYPFGKAGTLLLYGYLPPRYKKGRRVLGKAFYWLRVGILLPARVATPDIVIFVFVFVFFTGPYDIRMSWERGGWIFGAMFLCTVLSTLCLKRAN